MKKIEAVQLNRLETDILVYLLYNSGSTITEIFKGVKDKIPDDDIKRDDVKKRLELFEKYKLVKVQYFEDDFFHKNYSLTKESEKIAKLIKDNGYDWYCRQGDFIEID